MLKHNAYKTEQFSMSADDLAKFYTKDGWLSVYSLSCGYQEKIDHGDYWLTLWKEGCYHVRMHDFMTGTRVFWESFDSVVKARKFFKEQAQLLEAK